MTFWPDFTINGQKPKPRLRPDAITHRVSHPVGGRRMQRPDTMIPAAPLAVEGRPKARWPLSIWL